MKSPTTTTLTDAFPLVIPTQTQHPVARLVLRNDLGQVVQQWLVNQNKCTLGNSPNCSLRCELPGIAPYHALLVIGARQIFIRALAPKLTRDSRPFNEILLTDEDSHFEIAGHRFELSRTTHDPAPRSPQDSATNGRLKFTLARPFELKKRASAIDSRSDDALPPPSSYSQTSAVDSMGIAHWIQAAIQPIEFQLQNLIEPLTELQSESRKQKRLRRKLRAAKRNELADPKAEAEQQRMRELQERSEAQISKQVEVISSKHSAAIDLLTERISDVNQQLFAIERIISEERDDRSNATPSQEEISQRHINSVAIEQLQSAIAAVSAAIDRMQAKRNRELADEQNWKVEIQDELGSLALGLDRLSSQVAEVHQATGIPTVRQADEKLARALDFRSTAGSDRASSLYAEELESGPSSLCKELSAGDAQLEAGEGSVSSDTPTVDEMYSEPHAALVCTDAVDELIRHDDELPNADDLPYTLEEPLPSLPTDWHNDPDFGNSASVNDLPNQAELREEPVTNMNPQPAFEGWPAADEEPVLPSWWVADDWGRANSECTPPAMPGHDPIGFDPDAERLREEVDNQACGTDAELSSEPLSSNAFDQEDLIHEPEALFSEQLSPQECYEPVEAAESSDWDEPVPLLDAQADTGADDLGTSLEADDEISDDRIGDSQITDDQITDDQITDEQITDDQNGETNVGEDASVEDYMRKLLARMRGVPEDEVEMPKSAPASPRVTSPAALGGGSAMAKVPAATDASLEPMPTPLATSAAAALTVPASTEATEPFNPEKYMPRALAPEKSQSLAAMRELANTSARSAIHKSTRQRHLSSIFLKAAIAFVGLLVGAVLLAINGLNVNIGLIATVAAFLVACIWGFDAASSIRPLLQAGLVLSPETPTRRQSTDESSNAS